MRLIYFGTPAAAVPPLEALLASRHEVLAVVTRPDKPRDHRGGRIAPSPVKALAEAAGLPVLQPERGRDPELPATLGAFRADAGATCAFGLLLPPAVLDVFPRRVLNVHFSLLPAYRGAAPVQRALLDGHTVTGVTTFLLDEGMDTGPTLLRAELPIVPDEDAGTLTARLGELGARLLVETLDALEQGSVQPEPQPASGASLAPKVTSEEARLDFTRSPEQVVDAVRAFTPAPGAWTTVTAKEGATPLRLKVLRAGVRPEPALTPGALDVAADGALVAGAGGGTVALEVVQAAGRRPMSGAEFARGAHLRAGSRVGV